jgi:hypothetical protein
MQAKLNEKSLLGIREGGKLVDQSS